MVEIVTGFGFEGWRIARNINQGLLRLLDKSGIESVSALRGAKTTTFTDEAFQQSKGLDRSGSSLVTNRWGLRIRRGDDEAQG